MRYTKLIVWLLGVVNLLILITVPLAYFLIFAQDTLGKSKLEIALLFIIIGDIIFLMIMLFPIRRILNSEKALQESKTKYKKLSQEFNALLDAIPDSLTLHSKDLKIIWANKGALKRVKTGITNLVGEYCYNLWHDKSNPIESCPIRKTFETGESILIKNVCEDGTIWEIRTVPIKNDIGEVIKVIKVARDITTQTRLEEQLQHSEKMEAIGQLSAGIAHEYNNILTAILGYGNILQMRLSHDPTIKKYLDCIIASAEKAAKLTHNLLAFSRKQISTPRLIDLNEVVKYSENYLLNLVKNNIKVNFALSQSELFCMLDPAQITQVLINLFENAKDAMPNGGTLTIETGSGFIDENFIIKNNYSHNNIKGCYGFISVTDTGVGIDDKILSYIFQPFFTTKEVGKGTGLGLATVYGIVKQHGGYISVDSKVGVGSTFKLYFPLIKSKSIKNRT